MNKKIPQVSLLMYNKFGQQNNKGVTLTADLLYNKKNIIGRLFSYFQIYFSAFSISTAQSLFLLVLSMPAMESADSIRYLYRHFLSKVTQKSLNAFYYACSYAKIECSIFMNTTARPALGIIPESLKNEPVFLCIDDAMTAKYGQKSEDVSKLFDHAAHNGSNYLNGHCFVNLMLCVTVWDNRKIVYQSVPPGCSTYLCSYMGSAGTLKSATMSRKHSGHCVHT